MNTRNRIAVLLAAIACAASIQAHAGHVSTDAAIEHGVGDMYGSVLLDTPDQATTDATIERGEGDMYGSVLLDTPDQATTDATIERGEGDMYGSVLLDIELTKMGVTQVVGI
jgi:hypothetical protein